MTSDLNMPASEQNEQHPPMDWQEIVKKKRQQRADRIEAFRDVAIPQDNNNQDVTAVDDIEALSEKLASGEQTSEGLVKAYIARAIEAQDKTNCLTEILFEEAVSRAQALDETLSQTGKTVGPLHGIPMSLKDQFDVANHDSTIGYVGRAFQPASRNSVLVDILHKLGAVFIGKTNLPQSIMWCETENPLWGLTTNPMNPEYTPGGSTGGESALLSMHGSVIGWGTDIGGSVRIPAHMMGLYGLKPSSGRLPYHGVPVSTEGQEHVHSAVGPLARSLSSLHLTFKHVILAKPWTMDSQCLPIPWRDDMYTETRSRKLTIGLLSDDGVVEPHPCVSRVLAEAAALLRATGHTVVPWTPDLHAECIDLMDAYYTVDGGEDIRRDLEAGGEPAIPHVERLLHRGQPISVYAYWQLHRRKKALRQAYLDRWQARPGMDVLLTPVMPHAAVPHRACRWVGYTKVWNLLDYPAISVPAGHVTLADVGGTDKERSDGPPRNEADAWNRALWRERGRDMAEMGLPVGVQIVGRPLEEERVLAAAAVLDDLLRARRA